MLSEMIDHRLGIVYDVIVSRVIVSVPTNVTLFPQLQSYCNVRVSSAIPKDAIYPHL